jgi:hypothetical protein
MTPRSRKEETMSTGIRKPLAAVAALGAALALSVGVATASPTQVGPDRVVVDPKTFKATVDLACPADGEACVGILHVETATAIKPYKGRAAKKWQVGSFPFSVPAGESGKVMTRVYGGALAQLMRTGTVKLRVSARNTATGQNIDRRVLTFVMKRR